MRSLLLFIGLLLPGSPAAAQIWDGGGSTAREVPPPVPGVRPLLAQTRADIRDGRRAGQLDRREARGLRRESRLIARLEDRYRAAGLSEGERAELRARADALHGLVVAHRSRPRN